jgi:hypothetical protein
VLRRWRSLSLALVAVIAIASSRSSASDLHAAEDVTGLLSRAGANVQALARSLAVVICNERYMQQFRDSRDKSLLAQRTLHSEVLFRWLAEEDLWLSIRGVKDIDGVAVAANSMPWEAALADASPTERLRQLQTVALKYDIGPVLRTTSDSTLVLRFLLPVNQSRFRFRDDGRERIDRQVFQRLTFVEERRPTLVQVDDEDSSASGTIWLRPRDGSVVRTRVDLKSARNLKVHLEVEFREDTRLAAWVPSRMEERYETPSGQFVVCVTTYTDFRRFETAGRIVAPQ